MAAKYRKIDPRKWDDEAIQGWLADGKLLEVIVHDYLITSKQTNRIGIYVLSVALGAETLHVSPHVFDTCVDTICTRVSWRRDKPKKVLYIPTWWKYQRPDNPDALIGTLEDLHDLPQTSLLAEFAVNTLYLPDKQRVKFQTCMDTWATRVGTRGGTPVSQEQEQEQEQDQSSDRPEAAPEDPPIEEAPSPDMILAIEATAYMGPAAHAVVNRRRFAELVAECDGDMNLARECIATARANAKAASTVPSYALSVAAGKRQDRLKAKPAAPRKPVVSPTQRALEWCKANKEQAIALYKTMPADVQEKYRDRELEYQPFFFAVENAMGAKS